MSEVGDVGPTPESDLRKKGEKISEIGGKTEDLEIKMLKIQPRQYKRNILTNAQQSIAFLVYQSLVDFVEADGEYIVSAGRDHDINVWDAAEGTHIRRLSGHSGPVTGLHLHDSGETPPEKIIVSSSEDGTIRQWFLNKGEEFRKFETENLITCMGIINNIIAVSGNHKGYMEVRHLATGDLYSTILAHMDPIDALAVEGNYACSATFDAPSCLKVWEIQFEQTICIYRIENQPEIEFDSLAIWNTTAILGASNEQKLHIVNFKTDVKESIYLSDPSKIQQPAGKVQHVRVWNNWILSCSARKRDVALHEEFGKPEVADRWKLHNGNAPAHTAFVVTAYLVQIGVSTWPQPVHRINNYEHFGTFCSNMQQVSAIAAVESDSNLKIILGGSALIVLGFHFNDMQGDTKIPIKRSTKSEKSSWIQYKKRGHYTMKNTETDEYPDDKSSDSEERESSSEDEATYKSMLIQQHSDYTKVPEINLECTEERNIEYTDDISNKSNRPIFPAIPFKTMEPIGSHLPFVEKHMTEDMFECIAEPRITVKKLEKFLDECGQQAEPDKSTKSYENYESSKEIIDNIMKKYTESTSEDVHKIDEENIEENVEPKNDCEITTEASKTKQENIQLLKENTNDFKSGDFENLNVVLRENNENADKVKCKFYFKRNRKSKPDKKNSEKSKHKMCKIM